MDWWLPRLHHCTLYYHLSYILDFTSSTLVLDPPESQLSLCEMFLLVLSPELQTSLTFLLFSNSFAQFTGTKLMNVFILKYFPLLIKILHTNQTIYLRNLFTIQPSVFIRLLRCSSPSRFHFIFLFCSYSLEFYY